MRAIVITKPGGPEVLEERTVADPVPGASQILVRVHATSLNRADLMQRRGTYAPPAGVAADIPGLDYAGVVERVGTRVTRHRAGDRVMGIVPGASYAELLVTHEDEALRVPDNLSLEEAAAVPEVFLTAHDALCTQMQLNVGESLLIHAVGSGVGTAALQLAKAYGARVLGTNRSAWKLARAQELGLDVAIESDVADWPDRVRANTDGNGVDVVMDLVGGTYLSGDIAALAHRGRLIVVGLVAGSKAEIDFRMLMNKRATVKGTMLRSRTLDEKIAVARAFELTGLPLLADGRVRPIIDAVLPMREVQDAHRQLEQNENFGKIVLRWA